MTVHQTNFVAAVTVRGLCKHMFSTVFILVAEHVSYIASHQLYVLAVTVPSLLR